MSSTQKPEVCVANGLPEGIKRRLNLQTIGSFVRNGGDVAEIRRETFEQRERAAYEKMERGISRLCGVVTEEVVAEIVAYACVIEEINFNMGMKAGAALYRGLTEDFDTDL